MTLDWRWTLGALALFALWLNTGLILAVALRQLGQLQAMRRRLRAAAQDGSLVRGIVSRTTQGVLAVRRVPQIGRATTDGGPSRILFSDGLPVCEGFSGELTLDDGNVLGVDASRGQVEIWMDGAQLAREANATDTQTYSVAHQAASKFRGYSRELQLSVNEGDSVWAWGERTPKGIASVESGGVVLSYVDPLQWCIKSIRALWSFLVVAIVLLATVTAVAFVPPIFGSVSALGAVLCLAYFLAVQPIGTQLRDLVRRPGHATVGGVWHQPVD